MVKLDVMEQDETIRKLLPPRVIDSFTAGISQIEKRPFLLVFPILFNLFLWLGPKLSIEKVVLNFFGNFLQEASVFYETAQVDIQPLFDLQAALEQYLGSFNLFSILSTFPVGIPGLFSNVDTTHTPIGSAEIFSISSFTNIVLVSFVLAFVGILTGTVFLRAISPRATENRERSFMQQFLQSLIYTVLMFTALGIGAFLSIMIASVFEIFLPVLGQFLLLMLLTALILSLLPAFYAFIPIFLYGQSFFQAILTSYKVIGLRLRYQLNQQHTVIISPRIIPFTMSILILYQGLNIVWLKLPKIDSWWMLVSIIGHGFVVTLIALTCFDFFQSMCRWHQRIAQVDPC